MSTENTENNVVELDINNPNDRETFNNERLFPSLKRIYSGIMGAKTPIIVGSVALYLQGVYLDHFPKDIDIIFEDETNPTRYNVLFSKKLCKRFGFSLDFLHYHYYYSTKNDYELFTYKLDDIDIKLGTVKDTVNFYNNMKDYWEKLNGPEKVKKYKKYLEYIHEHYPELFETNAEEI